MSSIWITFPIEDTDVKLRSKKSLESNLTLHWTNHTTKCADTLTANNTYIKYYEGSKFCIINMCVLHMNLKSYLPQNHGFLFNQERFLKFYILQIVSYLPNIWHIFLCSLIRLYLCWIKELAISYSYNSLFERFLRVSEKSNGSWQFSN